MPTVKGQALAALEKVRTSMAKAVRCTKGTFHEKEMPGGVSLYPCELQDQAK